MRRSAKYTTNNGLKLASLMLAVWASVAGESHAQQGSNASGLQFDTTLLSQMPNVGPSGPYHSSDGTLQWNFVIKNSSLNNVDIPAGVRFTINLDIPGRLKMVYFDSRPPLPNTIQTQNYWHCDSPYNETSAKPYGPAPHHFWGGSNNKHTAQIPGKFNCHFVTDVPVPAGKEIRHLFVYTDGGFPSSEALCALSSTWSKINGDWKKNGDPVKQGSNKKCFKKPAGTNPSVDFTDLQLELGMVGVGTAWQTWKQKIANIGANPIPIMKSVITEYKPLSGFEYKTYLPPGASLFELRVTRGWLCKLQEINPPKPPNLIGIFPASGRIPLSGPEQTFQSASLGSGANGRVLACTYGTEYEFASQAKLAQELYSEPVYYVTTNWPMAAHPTKCSVVTSIHGSGPNAPAEPTNKLANNRSCVNVSTGQPTQCPATCPPLW